MSWLLDTLVWTGVLIAAVLLVRRPVARQFGAKAAYALWFLPLLRLALPPIVLPAWLAPAKPAAEVTAEGATAIVLPAAAAPAASAAIDWIAVAGALWLAGGLVYIALRLTSYTQLRRELFRDARTVGHEGPIRLIETSATRSPLAFGVFDKVVALPPGFMAWTDRRQRDLALSHELAHHRAHDLLFNFLALPLFALHWFNPLSLLGWRAMRRDQEAACDVRVVEHRDASDRAVYAQLIASAVAGPRGAMGAMAAPMACPVLGDKSIVQRLRNLTMSTPSQRRRRLGAALVGASVLLVPLTASISYAQDEAIDPPLPPAAPAAPEAPHAPYPVQAPEATYPAEPDVPAAPEAPLPPAAPLAADAPPAPRAVAAPEARRVVRVTRVERETRVDGDKPHDLEALEMRLSRLGEEIERAVVVPRIDVERVTAEARRAARVARAVAPDASAVAISCDSDDAAGDKGRSARACRAMVSAHGLGGLRAARAQIAQQRNLSAEARSEILESLDREIERLQKTN